MSKVRLKDGDLPQEFVEPTTFEQAEMLLGYKVKTVDPQKEDITMPIERTIGMYEKPKNGKWRYKYRRNITPKQKVLASLLSFGFSQTESGKMTGYRANSQPHVSMAVKDDQMVDRIESNVEEMVAQAKTIIQEAAVKAAENFKEAVNEGDLKASGKVLEFCGAFRKQSDVNINMNFGEWLKQTQADRAIDITPESQTVEVEAIEDLSEAKV